MNWKAMQDDAQSKDNYQAYIITRELEGRRCPSYESIIRLLKGKNNEKIQNQKR